MCSKSPYVRNLNVTNVLIHEHIGDIQILTLRTLATFMSTLVTFKFRTYGDFEHIGDIGYIHEHIGEIQKLTLRTLATFMSTLGTFKFRTYGDFEHIGDIGYIHEHIGEIQKL